MKFQQEARSKVKLHRLKWLLQSLESGRREVSDSDTFEGGVLSIGGEHVGWQGEWFLDNPRFVSRDYFTAMSTGKIRLNDVLLVKDGATIGKVAIATENSLPGTAAVNEHVFILRFKESQCPKFHFYALQSPLIRDQIGLEIRGAAQPGLNSEFRSVVLFPEPSKDIQRVITDYLDKETSRIDALVMGKKRMLALLEEKRSTLISQAVTKGINPDAPLKPSGLNWLGNIPENWEVRRLKFVSITLDQGSSPVAANIPANPDELGILKLSAVNKGKFRREENKALRETDKSEQVLSLKRGDILITRGNTPELVADVACVPNDEPNLLLPDLIYRLRVCSNQVLPDFLTYFLTTQTARIQIQRDARGSSGSMVKVSQGHVLNWRIPLPPVSEQEAIVRKIKIAEEKSKVLLTEISGSIDLLKERRAALITAAVTGQIPVEEMAA